MPQENPINPDWTIQEERLQYGAEKRKQRDTARLIWASKPRKEPSPKDLDFQTAEIVIPNKATGDFLSFFDTEKMEILHQFSIHYINTIGHMLLPQNIFDEMEGSRCEANLALLKMRK